jgi:hypothetical protein
MRTIPCIAIMSTIIAMSGCVIDDTDTQNQVEDQEEEPSTSTVESEIDNPVRLNVYGTSGGMWQWSISNLSNSWACRRVVFVNWGVGVNRWVGPGGIFFNATSVRPWYLIAC